MGETDQSAVTLQRGAGVLGTRVVRVLTEGQVDQAGRDAHKVSCGQKSGAAASIGLSATSRLRRSWFSKNQESVFNSNSWEPFRNDCRADLYTSALISPALPGWTSFISAALVRPWIGALKPQILETDRPSSASC